jgi:pimeloyl-ACP methyl ester carboxylesterase
MKSAWISRINSSYQKNVCRLAVAIVGGAASLASLSAAADPPAMRLTEINGVELEIWDRGSGEPVVFVHGSMGDECFAVLEEPALTNHYRLIHYHRRGWGNSERLKVPLTIAQEAADCRAVMHHVGVERAHLVGQSYGGKILLQMALDAPDGVHTLALLEPALPSVLFAGGRCGVCKGNIPV